MKRYDCTAANQDGSRFIWHCFAESLADAREQFDRAHSSQWYTFLWWNI